MSPGEFYIVLVLFLPEFFIFLNIIEIFLFCFRIVPNCTTKIKSERRQQYIADQINNCKDLFGTFFTIPFRKGFLVNWEVERKIWDYVFTQRFRLHRDRDQRYSDTGIIFTEPVYNFRSIRENVIELLFEDYGFGEVLITTPSDLAAYRYFHEENTLSNNPKQYGCCVVDSGYSFTHVTPYLYGHKILKNTKRINIGGKIISNYIKDIVSYRQLNLLEETHIVNKMKEDCCYVSNNILDDLQTCQQKQNPIKLEYVLPDFVTLKNGFVLNRNNPEHMKIITNESQIVTLNNERIQAPELLFYPSDVNIDQAGIADTIVHSISNFRPKSTEIPAGNDDANNEHSQKSNLEPPAKLERPSMREIDSDDDEIKGDDEKHYEPVRRKSTKKLSAFAQKITTQLDSIDLSFIDDENLQAPLLRNILTIGGNCSFPNFHRRLYSDVRSSIPDVLDVNITVPDNPVNYAWYGGQLLCKTNENSKKCQLSESIFHSRSVTRKQYKELGATLTSKYFTNMLVPLCVDSDAQ